jgi:hypothetical protein
VVVVAALNVVVDVSSVSPICRRAAARNTHAKGDCAAPPDTAPRNDDTRLRTTVEMGDAIVFGCTGSWGAVVAAGAAAVASDTESCWLATEVAVCPAAVASAVFTDFTVRVLTCVVAGALAALALVS